MSTKPKRDYGIGWAWKCSFGICNWAEPSKADLLRYDKPSPEAKAVRVRIVQPERTK
jgi:hypothetical protein